jgi:DNA invertase Pin-like site-specific DNA recombinase
VQSVPEILGSIKALSPRAAMSQTNGAMESRCSTGVIDRLILDGEEIILTYLEETNPRSKNFGRRRYVAIYVRVSTGKQADGFSPEDQAERAIRYCISKRLAFRVFVDTTLSGSMPPNIPHLVEKMRRKRASRFETIFTNIFLSPYVTRYTSAQVIALETYRDERVERIHSGGSSVSDGVVDDDVEEKIGEFRPGLTCLLLALSDIHEVVVTDLSRIARSAAITEEVIERLIEKRIPLIGLIEPIGDLEGIGTKVLTWQAEQFLSSLTANSIRGTLALLESGRAPSLGNIPWWCDRDSDGRAVPHPVRWKVAREIIDRFLAGEQPYEIWTWLIETDYPAPSKGRKEGKNGWAIERITKHLLDDSSARGILDYYGLEWPVLPSLVTDDEWWDIRELRAESIRPKRGAKETAANRVGTGLLKCLCGGNIYYHEMKSRKQADQYTCKGLRQRRTPEMRGRRHITIIADLVDAFFNHIMTGHPVTLLQRYAGGKNYDPVGESILSLSARLESKHQERRSLELKVREEATALYKGMGLIENTPVFENLVLQLVSAKTQEIKETVRRLDADLLAEQKRQQALQVTADWSSLTRQAERWDSLTDAAKNKVLRALFVEFRWHRNEETGKEWIVPVLRAAEPVELDHIRVFTRGKTSIRRSLEPASEWMARVLGVSQTKTVMAGVGLVEPTKFVSLAARDFQPGDDDAERGALSTDDTGRVTVQVCRRENLDQEPAEDYPDEGE